MSNKKNKQKQLVGQTKLQEPARTRANVNADYGQACAQLGERQYKLSRLALEIESLAKRIDQLHQEANEMDAKAAKEAQEAKSPAVELVK